MGHGPAVCRTLSRHRLTGQNRFLAFGGHIWSQKKKGFALDAGFEISQRLKPTLPSEQRNEPTTHLCHLCTTRNGGAPLA
jgi:hypothetical protein